MALGLPWALAPVAIVLGAFEIGASLHLARRQVVDLGPHTADARAAYPEEFATVRDLLADMAHRAGLATPSLFIASNRQIDHFTVLGRHLVVTVGLLQSLAKGHQHRRDGEAMIAHELGHVAHRRIGLYSTAYALTRALRYAAVGLVLINLSALFSFAIPGLPEPTPLSLVTAIAIAILAHPLSASLAGLISVAGEFDADVYAIRLLDEPDQLASSLAKTEVRNIAQVMARGATWAGARDIIAILRSLAPLYPQARLNGKTLAEAAALMDQALREQGPRTPGARLDDGVSRLRRTWVTGVIRSHPDTGERVRVLIGSSDRA